MLAVVVLVMVTMTIVVVGRKRMFMASPYTLDTATMGEGVSVRQ
ncbi:hypothetical protein HRbin05_00715 [archaeon HR05]|nr:hypothetical protein HRbin05_00715 [archaeon HR05]